MRQSELGLGDGPVASLGGSHEPVCIDPVESYIEREMGTNIQDHLREKLDELRERLLDARETLRRNVQEGIRAAVEGSDRRVGRPPSRRPPSGRPPSTRR